MCHCIATWYAVFWYLFKANGVGNQLGRGLLAILYIDYGKGNTSMMGKSEYVMVMVGGGQCT